MADRTPPFSGQPDPVPGVGGMSRPITPETIAQLSARLITATPPFSGEPAPVFGVTGGPGFGGTAGIDNENGNFVFSPPGNSTQIKSGGNPQSFQVFEYDTSDVDYSRLNIQATVGGPFEINVETSPEGVIRGLVISARGPLSFNVEGVQISVPGPSFFGGITPPLPANGQIGDFYFNSGTPTVAGTRIYVKTTATTWTGIV